MIRRLRQETEVSDPSLARAVDLIRAAPKPGPSQQRRQRAWAALERSALVRRPMPRLTIALASLIAALGLASAGPRLWRGIATRPQPRSSIETTTQLAPVVRATAPANDEVGADRPTVAAGAVDVPARRPSIRHRAAPAATTAPQAPSEPTAPTASPTTGDDIELVLRARLALRSGGSLKEVLSLLTQYRAQYPQGSMTELALGLSMETMVALDDFHAAELATEYLERYPSGGFRATALKARELFGP